MIPCTTSIQNGENKSSHEGDQLFAQHLSKTTSTLGTSSTQVFMTRWTLPCVQQSLATGCIQAFGGSMKIENPLVL